MKNMEVDKIMTIVEALKKVINTENLKLDEMTEVMDQIMSGNATNAQIAAFLVALRLKGETVDEITGAAKGMRDKSIKIKSNKEILVDTCGTGGDNTGTFNISTVAAFVVAAAGVAVAKHGNRSVSSKSGSADVLEALGTNLDIDNKTEEELLEKLNIVFLYAVKHHKSMKYAIAPRREMGIRTIFNILGPLTNPANANIQLMGIYSKDLVLPIAKVLRNLGLKRAMVVSGEDGLDELTITGKTNVAELKDGKIETYQIDANDFFEKRSLEEIKGGNADENAEIMKNILSGKEIGAKKEIVALNSGAILYLTGKSNNIKDGIKKALEIIESGKGLEKLNEYIKFTNN